MDRTHYVASRRPPRLRKPLKGSDELARELFATAMKHIDPPPSDRWLQEFNWDALPQESRDYWMAIASTAIKNTVQA